MIRLNLFFNAKDHLLGQPTGKAHEDGQCRWIFLFVV